MDMGAGAGVSTQVQVFNSLEYAKYHLESVMGGVFQFSFLLKSSQTCNVLCVLKLDR